MGAGVALDMPQIPAQMLKEAFDFFGGKPDCASITAEQFYAMTRSLGQTPSNLELKVLLSDNCANSAAITLDEVQKMQPDLEDYTARKNEAKLLESFQVFDPDKTKKVSLEVFLTEILGESGEKMTEEEVENTRANLSESGALGGENVNYEEFVAWTMQHLNNAKQS